MIFFQALIPWCRTSYKIGNSSSMTLDGLKKDPDFRTPVGGLSPRIASVVRVANSSCLGSTT